jgi:hypothetical protein
MPWKWLVCLFAAAAMVATVSCSGGTALPRPGTPAAYWSDANVAYKAGDYLKTDENLQRIVLNDNDYTARARVWDMVISGGLAQGYSALADVYEEGAKNNRENPAPYRRRTNELRTLSGNMTLQVADGLHRFLEQPKEANVLMAFPFPAGSTEKPQGLTRLGKALFVPDTEQAQLLKAMLQRGVVLALSAATGNADDAAKAQQLFQTPDVKVARDTFLFASAKMLEAESDIFGSKKLDLPNKLKIALQEAQGALKAMAETKDSKALADKIQKTLKKANLAGGQ